MSKEIKPCVNDMCPHSGATGILNCYHWDNTVFPKEYKARCVKACSRYITEKPESAYKKIWKKFGVFIENCKANKGEATTALLCLLIAKHRVLEKEIKK